MCAYPIWKEVNDSGSVSLLNWGFLRDRGTVRTSATNVTLTLLSRVTKPSIDRVE